MPAVRAPALHALRGGAAGLWTTDAGYGWLVTALIWLLVGLMTLPDNFDYTALSAGGPPESGSAVSRLLWLTLLALPAVIIVFRWSLALLVLRDLNFFIVVFALLTFASLLWSEFPAITARRLIRVAAVMSSAVAFVLLSWHRTRFQSALRSALTAMLAGSLIFGLVRPDLAIHSETSPELLHAWRGLTNHKNSLGAAACVTLILWFHAWLTGEAHKWIALGGSAIAVACLVLSRSSTSMVDSVVVMAILAAIVRTPDRWRHWIPPVVTAFMVLLVIYALVILRLLPGSSLLLSPINLITGKDLSFTGRTEIWDIIDHQVSLHPWLGAGYGAYWIGPEPWAPVHEFVEKLHFYPGQAHNGYLDVLNDLGIAGLSCLLCYLAVYMQDGLRLLAADRAQAALFLGLFLQQAIGNLTEAHWFSVQSLDFAIMALATVSLARSRLQLRLRYYFGEPPPVRVFCGTPQQWLVRQPQPVLAPTTKPVTP
jgi:O-antigen ligase